MVIFVPLFYFVKDTVTDEDIVFKPLVNRQNTCANKTNKRRIIDAPQQLIQFKIKA